MTSSPRVRFFIFLYESGLVLKIVIEKYLFGAPFSPFISFFNFEHFPPKKSIKNTRPKTVAAVTRSPRVRFHLTFVWKMSIHHIFYFSKLRLHARTLLPAALASVSFGFVLVRVVRVILN